MELVRSPLNSRKIECANISFTQLKNNNETLERVLTPEAARFITSLHLRFGAERMKILNARKERTTKLSMGYLPGYLPETRDIREVSWKVALAPRDLIKRNVEITGPCEAKMMINALNSGADVFMADLEDSLSPTWENLILGQSYLKAAVGGTLSFRSEEGKDYALKKERATLIVRPRGWHLLEKNFAVNGEHISASIFDFGLYFFHNARTLIRNGSGPYFYLPKMESHLEARLWNEIFVFAQEAMGIPVGTIRATVLIETILAAFEMEEILFELKEHASGLNAGRWDYLFSIIKKLSATNPIFPHRNLLTMELPFMQAYCEKMVQVCHRHGAMAIGGMSAFIPSRRDCAINEVALDNVRKDKLRELKIGFDGTWVAHPDLVGLVKQVYAEFLGKENSQFGIVSDRSISEKDLLPSALPAIIGEEDIRANISIALIYIQNWLGGTGAVAINNLMEDVATAEISRSLLWQWVRASIRVKDGYYLTKEKYQLLLEEEVLKMKISDPKTRIELQEVMDFIVTSESMVEFLTLPAYELLATNR